MKNLAVVGLVVVLLAGISFAALGGDDKKMSTAEMVKQMNEMNMHAAEMLKMAGEKFDADFLDMMISHHEGALLMSEEALSHAKHAELKKMAEEMIAAQKKEIQQMKDWRKAWF